MLVVTLRTINSAGNIINADRIYHVEGETPLGGNWTFDWQGGVAVLFGDHPGAVLRQGTCFLAD